MFFSTNETRDPSTEQPFIDLLRHKLAMATDGATAWGSRAHVSE